MVSYMIFMLSMTYNTTIYLFIFIKGQIEVLYKFKQKIIILSKFLQNSYKKLNDMRIDFN